jgi:hypothetical protein
MNEANEFFEAIELIGNKRKKQPFSDCLFITV